MRGIFWLLLVSVFSAAALFWLFFADSVPPDPVPARPAETATAQPDPVIPPPEISAPPEDASAAATPLIVDTFPANAQPPIDTWERVGDIGGHFDVLLFQSTGAPVAPGFPIQPDMVVQYFLRNWLEVLEDAACSVSISAMRLPASRTAASPSSSFPPGK